MSADLIWKKLAHRKWPLTIAVIGFLLSLGIGPVWASVPGPEQNIPFGQSMTGEMTYFNISGTDACGTHVDPATQDAVAVSPRWFTAANSNNDPLCSGVSVQLTYNGQTLILPVMDSCASCDLTHIGVSQKVFQQLAPLSVGALSPVTWQFVLSSGQPGPSPSGSPSSAPPSGPSSPAPGPSSAPNSAAVPGRGQVSANGASGSLENYFAPAFSGASSCHFSHQNFSINSGVLTTSYPAGSSSQSAGPPYGGAQICIPSSSGPQPTLALTYSVRFPVGFQFVKGGKLPGIYGGVPPFSGGNHNPNGWSMRLMWRAGGGGEVYSYTAQTAGYGDDYGRGNFSWQADGNWHTVTERVTVNTPGASNGSVTLTYDGKQVIDQTGIDITNTNTPAGGLFFSTFYGGHDSSWAPAADQSISFQNFSVSG